MNRPYVKIYDEKGILTNPITDAFVNQFSNRTQRRELLNQPRFRGNGKNYPLTVVGNLRYLRTIQVEFDKDGKRKEIYHYVPCGASKRNSGK